jgi:hypothetical protein
VALSSQRRLTTEMGVCDESINARFCAKLGVWTECERAVEGVGDSIDECGRNGLTGWRSVETGIARFVEIN